jgi:hypothetical protein
MTLTGRAGQTYPRPRAIVCHVAANPLDAFGRDRRQHGSAGRHFSKV